jgi:multimeric flavodoxin WrbA
MDWVLKIKEAEYKRNYNFDAKKADKAIKYCKHCNSCWEKVSRDNKRKPTYLYYEDFPTRGKQVETCINCKR